jgi:hypothetical protein
LAACRRSRGAVHKRDGSTVSGSAVGSRSWSSGRTV